MEEDAVIMEDVDADVVSNMVNLISDAKSIVNVIAEEETNPGIIGSVIDETRYVEIDGLIGDLDEDADDDNDKEDERKIQVVEGERLTIEGIASIVAALKECEQYIDPRPYKLLIPKWFGYEEVWAFKANVPIKNLRGVDIDDEDNPANAYNCSPFIAVEAYSNYIDINVNNQWFGTKTYRYDVDGDTYISFIPSNKYDSMLGLLTVLVISGYNVTSHIRIILFEVLNHNFNVSIDSVELAGMDDVVDEIMEVLTINDPRLIPRHILLGGEMGCGKSEIVKQVIKRTPNWLHYQLNSDLYDWKRLILKLNKLLAFLDRKALIIIDEIDEIGMDRNKSNNTSEQSVYTLLRVLDGVDGLGNTRIIATTNRPNDLDPALKRVGRFGPICIIESPTDAVFEKIVQFYIDRYGGNETVAIPTILAARNGATGCDIRAAFENCIIHKYPITTDTIIRELKKVLAAKSCELKNYV
ncbi:MAG: AAA family ATPase [Bacteroidales bacterium]|jgi:hypothetical protein